MDLKVAPSVLSADFAQLGKELARIEAAAAHWVHLDVMDGQFVPNLTFGPPVIAAMRSHSSLVFDVHLMIESPELAIAEYRKAGADQITVHAEACRHLHRTVCAIRELGARAGVALNPGTSIEAVEYVLAAVDLVLVMTVNPGFGGQLFLPEMLPKIRRVRELIGDLPIDLVVDGGVSPKTAPAIVAAGANVLVAGNSLFRAGDLGAAVQTLLAAR